MTARTALVTGAAGFIGYALIFFVLDDVGYGQMSAFGGLVNTPNLDRWMDDLKQRPAFQKWGMVTVGKNNDEWLANEKKLG